MFHYRIADFNIEFHTEYAGLPIKLKKYETDFESPDLTFTTSQKDIEFEKKFDERTSPNVPDIALELSVGLRLIAERIPLHNAFLLHSAAFDVDGTGVAFAAHSGTGKTTHMLLWQKLLGDRMTVVNGDKPIIRFFEDEPSTPYAYGTPWNGKEHLGCNMRTPLRHICFIERAAENSCEKMEKSDAVNRIFNQVYMPKDPAAMMKTIELINRLIDSCELWLIRCNMDPAAAETAYRAIFG